MTARSWHPAWWFDIDVRLFVLGELGRAPVAEVVRLGQARFGPRAPSKSSLYRFVRGNEQGAAVQLLTLIEPLPDDTRIALAARLATRVSDPSHAPALALLASLISERAAELIRPAPKETLPC